MISTRSLPNLKKRRTRSTFALVGGAGLFIGALLRFPVNASTSTAQDAPDGSPHLQQSVAQDFSPPDYPVYVQQQPNPRDYTLFGTSGWDGNWYVGYNTCWIKKLPSIPVRSYERAYLGVKIGRMKSVPVPGKPWEHKAIPGQIDVAISSKMAWTKAQTHQLTTTADIPLEGDNDSAIEGTGAARWFWVEVPLSQINLTGENYVAVWSPTPELTSISSSPVLAAAWGGKEVNSWLAHNIAGVAPQDPNHTGATGISYFQPAISLKLIPTTDLHPIRVSIVSWQNGRIDHPKPTVTARIEGDSVVRAWLEYARDDSQEWKRLGRYSMDAPYIFNVDQDDLPRGHVRLRVAAANIWEEQSTSDAFSIDVSTLTRAIP